MGLDRNDVAVVVVSALVVVTAARLIGFIEFVASTVATPGEALNRLAAFWLPVLVPWLVLAALGVLLAAGASADEPGVEDSSQSFDVTDLGVSTTAETDSLERVLGRAESVLEGQLEVLADTDDKAVRTVRVKVILLGVAASTAQIASPGPPTSVWMRVSGVLIVGSIIAGIFTYSTSSPDLGPGPNFVRGRIEDGPRRMQLYLHLLDGYDEAIGHNREVVNASARYLFLTQMLLVAGVVCGGIGIAATV